MHELVHTQIHNHSKKFWNRLGELMPDYQATTYLVEKEWQIPDIDLLRLPLFSARICQTIRRHPMHIHPVNTRKDLASFIDLPYQLYKNDPVWVPPLRDEQRGQFDPKRNPLLDHCEWQLFLLEDRTANSSGVSQPLSTTWRSTSGRNASDSSATTNASPIRKPPGSCSRPPGIGCVPGTAPPCADHGPLSSQEWGLGGGRFRTFAGGHGPLQPAIL